MRNELCPKCSECGDTMHAVWFTEKETVIRNGILILTGKKRENVSHFECDCGNVHPVDDTFAKAWTN